jgi:hypothetical protein
MFHEDCFEHSSNTSIKGITAIIRGAILLIILMKAIYDLLHSDGLRWRGKHAMSHDDRFRHSNYFEVIASKI